MVKLSFKNKGIRSIAILIDCIILCAINRSYCQCKVVSVDVFMKKFSHLFLTDKILVKIVRRLLKRSNFYFPLIATHAEFDVTKSEARDMAVLRAPAAFLALIPSEKCIGVS